MHRISTNSHVLRSALFAAIAVAASIPLIVQIKAQEQTVKAEAEPSKLAADLIGTWQLVGRPDGEELQVNSLKFFTGKHWTVVLFDDNGKVEYSHGGTYTIDDDQYMETIKYATEQTASLIGQTLKFKIKVEDDKYTQIGVENPYNEVWRRAK